MFVCTLRASTIKFFAIIALTLAVLVGAIAIGGAGAVTVSAAVNVDFSGIKENTDRINFISSLGYKVKKEAVEEVTFVVPERLDSAMSTYNELQKSQGLDLTRYKNKKVTRFTYLVEEYPDYDKDVYVNLIVHRGTVIACDISSADPDGFVKPLISIE